MVACVNIKIKHEICKIATIVEPSGEFMAVLMQNEMWEAVEEQFLSKGTISQKQLEALENIYASINNRKPFL